MNASKDMAKRFSLGYYVAVDPERMPEQIEFLSELGVARLGTDGFGNWRDHAFTDEIAKIIKAGGLRPYSFHVPFGSMFADRGMLERHLDDARRIIDVAYSWGAESSVWHFRWLRSEDGDTHFAKSELMDATGTDAIDRLCALAFPEICDYAAKAGIGVNLENMPLFPWAEDSSSIFNFIRKLGVENLGFIYDIGHAWCSGFDPAKPIRDAGSLLRDTHFHDNLGLRIPIAGKSASVEDVQRNDLHLPPGLGTINWIEVVKAMRETGYSRPLTFEGPSLRAPKGSDAMESFKRAASISVANWRAFEDLARNIKD